MDPTVSHWKHSTMSPEANQVTYSTNCDGTRVPLETQFPQNAGTIFSFDSTLLENELRGHLKGYEGKLVQPQFTTHCALIAAGRCPGNTAALHGNKESFHFCSWI